MKNRTVTIVLGIGLVFSAMLLISRAAMFHLPGNQQDYEPVQPIAYSHRLHAGEMQIQCTYCHFAADKSRHAGIPAASICMNCHKFVTASYGALREADGKPVVSAELKKLYDAVESGKPIAWTRIHSLPDFVYFDHRPHVNKGVACQQCHGPVESMERVRQVSDLSMGWCVNCHRAKQASLNCSTCHF